MSRYTLTAEQRARRDAALASNLRYKFPSLANRSDEELVAAYDEWFMSDDGASDESEFVNYLSE